jgi:hypothetical protein
LKGSPFLVTAGNDPVNNQEVSASNSKAYGPGLERPKEQQKTHFTVETFDKNNTRMAVGGYEVKSDVSGSETPETHVKDNNDGTYTVEYTPTKAGQLRYKLFIVFIKFVVLMLKLKENLFLEVLSLSMSSLLFLAQRHTVLAYNILILTKLPTLLLKHLTRYKEIY